MTHVLKDAVAPRRDRAEVAPNCATAQDCKRLRLPAGHVRAGLSGSQREIAGRIWVSRVDWRLGFVLAVSPSRGRLPIGYLARFCHQCRAARDCRELVDQDFLHFCALKITASLMTLEQHCFFGS
jgi:hypothetical protein